MERLESKTMGFAFALEQAEDGTLREVKVVDRWFGQKPYDHAQPVKEITIRLRPFASYTEAYEIACYLNSKLLGGFSPVIDVVGA